MMRVTVIGLGAMGEPMAANLIGGGHAVSVVAHRRPESAERLCAQGAVRRELAAAVADSEAIVLMLPTSKEVEAAVLGKPGILSDAKPGTLVIDCSTSNPLSTRALHRQLAARGIALVDAPVTRGVAGARDGKLAFFMGGDPHDIERAHPLLASMGDTFIDMGLSGSGHEAKILVQCLSYGTVALAGDILGVGEALGLAPGPLLTALQAGASSKALDAFGARMQAREFDPPRVLIRDALSHLAVLDQIAQDIGLPPPMLTRAARDRFAAAAGLGHERQDISALAALWRRAIQSAG